MTAGTAPPVTQTQEPPLAPPFAAPFPVRGIDDVRRLAARPGRDADGAKHLRDLPQLGRRLWRPDGPDLPEDRRPGRRYGELSYRELLAGIHQTANLLHSLGLGPRDAVGILLPGCLEYHLALWGGEAAARCSR